MTSTAVQVVPSNLQLPAHLQTPDVIAAIAAANAAAAGGVRAGGFPSISIKANRFAIKDGDETTPLMTPPAAPGQPALPMGCLEVVVVDANPALSHTFYSGAWVEGENKEPDCRSANGVTPDSDVATPQSQVCATCPQYAWGSKISALSGKPIRACSDGKQLAVIPAGDLTYKMLGLQIKAGSLGNWGKYIQALSGRGYGVSTLVTNITFDQTSNGVLQFSFNRFLSAEEFAKVNERKMGDDVRVIVAQSRALAPAVATPALAAPAGFNLPALGAPAPAAPPAPPPPPAPPAPAPAPVFGFGAAPQPAAAPAAPAEGDKPQPSGVVPPVPAAALAEPPKRTRRTRAQIEAANAAKARPDPTDAISTGSAIPAHIPENIRATIAQVGVNSPAGQALLAAYPVPAAQTTQSAPAVTREDVGVTTAPASVAPATPVAASPIPIPTVGFGAAPAAPTAQTVAAGASLAEKLRAKLGLPPA